MYTVYWTQNTNIFSRWCGVGMSGGVISVQAAIGQQLGHRDPGSVHISSPHTAP